MGGYYLPGGATTASWYAYNASWDTELTATTARGPTTTEDMEKLFKWEHGDTVQGDAAKDHAGMQDYIDDINEAYGREDDYDSNKIYIDTFKDEPIGPRLKKGDM